MKLYLVNQILNNKVCISNPYKQAKKETKKLLINIKPNSKIGITVGSRGINQYSDIVKGVSDGIKEHGADPILIPSMGTHGGSEIKNQLKVLKELSITEETVGANLYKSLDNKKIGEVDDIPIYINKVFEKVDHYIVLNRVKQHTDFTGEFESGICKMLAVGIGAKDSAEIFHKNALIMGYTNTIKNIANFIINNTNILGAIAIVEGHNNQPIIIEGINKSKIFEREPQLLNISKKNSLKLPFNEIDVLLVQEIGKNISGTGMDTNVIGRRGIINQPEPNKPSIKIIVALDITEESDGNAIGVGLADIITKKLFDKIDVLNTSLNSLSSFGIDQGKIPCVIKNDKVAIEKAIELIIGKLKSEIRLVFIKNTNDLKEFYISKSCISYVKENDKFILNEEIQNLNFNKNGYLTNLF